MSRVTVSDLQRGMAGVSRQSALEAPGFVAQFPGVQGLVDRLGISECRRRLLHMLPGLFPAFLWFVPHRDPWGLPLILSVVAVVGAIMLLAIVRERDFARPNETLWHHSVIGYGIPVLTTLFLFPGRSELGFLTLGVVAFGDGSAALGGKLWGRRRLPWNRNKSWAGLICFLVAGTFVAAFNYWIEARPAVGYGNAVLIASAAAMAGAVVESLPIRSHDNLRVGFTAAITGLVMHILVMGW